MIYIFFAVIALLILLFVVLSIQSRKAPDLGLVDGRLRACPDTPNCVCSEVKNVSSFIEPLTFDDSTAGAWNKVKNSIQTMGGKIEIEQESYLWATFKTKAFRYIDDVEIRMDQVNGVIHIRSASRVGRSDFGTNRERVKILQQRYEHAVVQ